MYKHKSSFVTIHQDFSYGANRCGMEEVCGLFVCRSSAGAGHWIELFVFPPEAREELRDVLVSHTVVGRSRRCCCCYISIAVPMSHENRPYFAALASGQMAHTTTLRWHIDEKRVWWWMKTERKLTADGFAFRRIIPLYQAISKGSIACVLRSIAIINVLCVCVCVIVWWFCADDRGNRWACLYNSDAIGIYCCACFAWLGSCL